MVKLEFRRVLQFGILAFVLHNGEEALTMPGWSASRFPVVARQLGFAPLTPPTTERLYFGLLAVTLVPGVAVLVGAQGGAGSAGVYACLWVYGILFWNALVPHVTATLLLGSYTPGAVTAACVNIPLTVYLFGRALREGYATRAGLALTLGLAAVAYPLAMLVFWRAASVG